MDLTEEQVLAIYEWADGDPYVQGVRLFGSHTKGCARPDSDVDLAVTAEAGHYVALASEWETVLGARLGLTVHVRDFARNKAIRDACDECSRLLFQRNMV